jgi:hypothetical protein
MALVHIRSRMRGPVPSREVQELAFAVRRQFAIGAFHLDALREIAGSSTGADIPVPLQAHFEGILYSVDAARDKVDRLVGVLGDVAGRGKFAKWTGGSLVDDARRLRNQAAHYFYSKQGGTMFVVEKPHGSTYSGPRELIEYSSALVDQVQLLGKILPPG